MQSKLLQMQSKLLQKKPPLLLILGAVLLFIGGGAIAFWATSRRGQLAKTMPTGANAIPDDALMVLALSTDEGDWRRLRQFGTDTTQAQFDQLLVAWRDRLGSDRGLDFARDIRPWVGAEITLALLPSDDSPADLPPSLPTPELALGSNLVAVIPIADASRAQSDLGDRLNQANQVDNTPYRGIALQQIDGQGEDSLYAAVLNAETAVLSPQLSSLKQAIDAFRGDDSFADRPGVGKAFEQITETRPLARFYVDMPALAQTVSEATDPPIAANRLRAFQVPRGLVGAIGLKHRGVTVQAISWLEPGAQTFATGNKADQMPQNLPSDTLIAMSGGDFQQFWEDFQAGEQFSALLPLQTEDLALGLQTATGLNLEDDLLPWMAGEFALGMLTPPQASDAPDEGGPRANPALVIMIKTNDREAATATLAQLDTLIERRYRFAVEPVEIGGQPATRWTHPFDALVVTHGWLDGDIAFLAVGADTAELVAPAPRRSLAENSLFQATTGEAPRPNNGHFFVNLDALTEVENSLLLPPLPQAGLLSSEAIEAIGVTATVLSDRQVRYDITAVLKRGDRPGPLPAPNAAADQPQTVPETETSGDEPAPEGE